ncbi:MAG TPA: PaaX family transcriptional regulator C-terminal domain-containing protein [Microthrixaceae bacterium]|nr:PaaX family transcriptional regulator C-terminal domain-containing protein [Microthrixaceae bacterium]
MGIVERPLTARSVLASTLLGTDPPRLPVSFLVRTGELFGLSEGAVRTALSRMASAGEVKRDDSGGYELQGELLTRQMRQRQSRIAETTAWNGRWTMAVVATGSRNASDRSALRSAMVRLRMAELREGVWLRPDNLDHARLPDERDVVTDQCIRFDSVPQIAIEETEGELAGELWDLTDWSDTAKELRYRMHEVTKQLEKEDPGSLPSGFVLSAAVLRHFGADPLLPRELLPRHWPGERLRLDYDRYDTLFRNVLASWASAAAAAAGTAAGTGQIDGR